MERVHFDAELRALETCLTRMAGLVEARLEACRRALVERRAELADEVIAGDVEINALQVEIDDRAMRLLALQQPAARDLRFITAAVRANADLERLGDQAVNVAQTTLFLLDDPPSGLEAEVDRMARLAIGMLRGAMDAFLQRDATLARGVLERDDEVDRLRDRLFRELLDRMRASPYDVEPGVGLLLISRNLERVADHATNIAEDAIFLVEARDVRHLHGQQAS